VVTTWTEPNNGGADITSYTIKFMRSEGSFVEDATVCDGAAPVVIAAKSCTVASSHFTSEMFGLAWGSSI